MSQNDPVAAFRVEAGEVLEQVEQGLLDLGHRLDDHELIDAVFRGLHTLKGSGAMFGFDALASFTHHCETAFDRVRKNLCPHVPDKLAADAIGLQQNQIEAARRAETIATIARDIRSKLSAAHGALQIGDITRQRLEHVAQACSLLGTAVDELNRAGDPAAASALEGQVMAMLAAQVADAAADLQKESRLLGGNFRAIATQVATMVAPHESSGVERTSDGAFLQLLEQSVADVDAVTAQLRDADMRSTELGSEASATVRRLGERLTTIHRVTSGVRIMAWNSDLRSFRMGREGDGLARIATEIRCAVNTLEAVSASIASAFEQLNDAANAIGSPPDGDEATAGSLPEALAVIRAGALLTRQGMSGLDRDAGAIHDIVAEMTSTLDCETAFAEPLARINAKLDALAMPLVEASQSISATGEQLFHAINALYTMARERQVHARFSPSQDQPEAEVAAMSEEDDDCDGLF
nr:Hpt domain-containing protein [Sphingomonas sp. STIS6.2]